jgi:hypothetical protein
MEILNYTDFKDSIKGMVSKNDRIIETEEFWFIKRNKAKVILLPKDSSKSFSLDDIKKYKYSLNLMAHERLSMQYVPDKFYINKIKFDLKQKDVPISSKFTLNSLVSYLDKSFFLLQGKEFREIRETRNQLKKEEKVYYKDTIDNPVMFEKNMLDFIDRWNNTNGLKYRRTNHSGYDKNFFLNHFFKNQDSFYSLFFYDKITNDLIGYSIVSKEEKTLNCLPCYSYLLRKCTQDNKSSHIRNLTLYMDYCTFENIKLKTSNEKGFYIHWGASKGSLLKYKKKFPVYSETKIRFLTTNTKDLFKNE